MIKETFYPEAGCTSRSAINNEIADADFDDLLAMVKFAGAGTLDADPPIPTPFTKEHFGSGKHQPIKLKGIANGLNAHWIMSLDDARRKMEDWLKDYNEVRPHSAIGNKTPKSLINHPGAVALE